jgi:hypothetical protein
MKLFEVQAIEYNGEQEYSQSKLLAAENIEHARQIARDYFRQWYDDGDKPQDHNTDNPDEFEFICGCIRLKIKSIQEITLEQWIRTQIALHSISELPDELTETELIKAARCAIADIEGYLEYIDISTDDQLHPAAKTRRELLAALTEAKAVSCVYCSAAEYLAEEGRTIFVGPMNGGLWNGRVLDACIMSKKDGDKAAYEFLVKFGDQYASTLSDDKQRQWQEIKSKAAAKFVGNRSMTTHKSDPAADLLEACKVITSYTTDLLYQLDDQVNLSDIEEIQQAKEAIARYRRFIANQS